MADNSLPVRVGDTAPDFTLEDTEGNKVTLSELKGKWVVLYFYPEDFTPGTALLLPFPMIL